MRLDLSPPRTYSYPAQVRPAAWYPWWEVSLLVRVRVARWDAGDESWQHWAVGPAGGAARPIDPGRRAAFQGEPPGGGRGEAPALDSSTAEELVARILEVWHPRLFRSEELGLVSRIGEPLDAFRRRCLGGVAEALRGREPAHAEGLARLAVAVESVDLGPDELDVVLAKVGVGWYAEGVEPQGTGADLVLPPGARR